MSEGSSIPTSRQTEGEQRLTRAFYERSAQVVARELLGKRLVRLLDGVRLSGVIVETEAYCDAEAPDLACHGTRNKGRPTKRTSVMFGPPGHLYVYFTYGMHWMLNVVTGREGQANAVLLRALQPSEGVNSMAVRRSGRKERELTNGPAKMAQALGVDGSLNGTDLCRPNELIWIEDAPPLAAEDILSGPRVGLGKTPEPWLSIPWRYWILENRFVSRQMHEVYEANEEKEF